MTNAQTRLMESSGRVRARAESSRIASVERRALTLEFGRRVFSRLAMERRGAVESVLRQSQCCATQTGAGQGLSSVRNQRQDLATIFQDLSPAPSTSRRSQARA